MLAIWACSHLLDDPHIFKAFNPYYAIKLLVEYPSGFLILGGVFLCTTGAEAMYSDLGHCGKWNIRYSWIFVKTCLDTELSRTRRLAARALCMATDYPK